MVTPERFKRSSFKGCHIPTLFIITVTSNAKYQCFKVTYQVLIPKYFMSFFCYSSFLTVRHTPMRDSVLNAVVLVCTESGESFSCATSPKSKSAICREQCESRCHAALI